MICYEKYEEKERVKTLPCFHFYHVKCIGEWFSRNHDTCPECRFSIVNNAAQELLDDPIPSMIPDDVSVRDEVPSLPSVDSLPASNRESPEVDRNQSPDYELVDDEAV